MNQSQHVEHKLDRLDLPQGQRVMVQITISLVFIYAVFTAYKHTDIVMDGMAPASQYPDKRFDEQPTAVVLIGAFLAFVCASFVFITLRDTKMGYLN